MKVIKASTALSTGVTRMGETCGALIGGVMGIGLVVGSEKLEDHQAYETTMEYSNKLCNQFKKRYGTTYALNSKKKSSEDVLISKKARIVRNGIKWTG